MSLATISKVIIVTNPSNTAASPGGGGFSTFENRPGQAEASAKTSIPRGDEKNAGSALSRLLSLFRSRRHDGTATSHHEDGPLSIFLVAKVNRVWRVSQDGAPYGEFETRGDAVRAACFGARTSDAAGRPAQVLALPGRLALPHYEPHFAA